MTYDNDFEYAIPCNNCEELLISGSSITDLQLSKTDMVKHIQELTLQNAELRFAKEQAELAKAKYAALYDLSPSGYFTLSQEGEIMESNISGSQMLCRDCLHLKNSMFDFFVSENTKPVFNHFLRKVFNYYSKASCEVIICASGNKTMNVHLSGIISLNHEFCLITAVDITEYKTDEVALAESKDLYSDLVANQIAGIYRLNVEKKGNGNTIIESISMEYVNDRFYDLFKIKHNVELTNINDVVFERIHPDDKQSFKISNELARLTQQPYLWEGRLLFDTLIKWIRFESGPRKLENGNTRWTGVAIDITGQKLAEETLRLSEKKYRQLYESIMDAVGFVDMTGRIINSNNSFQKMVGYSEDELLTLNYCDLTPDKWYCFESDIVANQVINRGYSELYEKEYIRKDGTIFPLEIRSFLLKDDNDQPTGIWSIVRDISERKRVETELNLKNQELRIINAEKDKFFSIIAHDLRNPFSGFLGLTELMAEGLPRMTLDEIQKMAFLLRTSAANLYRLLGNLLEWACMQRGITPFDPVTCILLPKVSACLMLVMESAKNKEIEIYLDIPEGLEVFADGNMLEGIIRNLLSNAVKFTPKKGSITVAASLLPDNSVEISIEDTGIGMNSKIVDNLFRLEINMKRKGTEGEYSTGLGLTICKDFIEKHGGKLWVKSIEGAGSTFYINLPKNPSI